MKGSLTLVASALAAAAITSSTTSDREVTLNPFLDHQVNSVKSLARKEKYAPKIDGLRFIETLITAHRF